MQYSLLKQKISQLKPNTITVDVFDTLLLRRWQPESWRFYILAKQQATRLNKSGFHIKPLFLYEQRKYFSKTLRAANLDNSLDHETSLVDIFAGIIDNLAIRQDIKISKSTKQKLIKKLIEIELNYELSQLYPNKKLVELLKKEVKNSIKIYFVSDMYLSSTDIALLLKKNGANFLNGGISSADEYVGKHSGRSFEILAKKYKNIQLSANLHIGDHRVGDGKNPKKIGSNCVWLYLPFHRAKLQFGKFLFGAKLKLKQKFEYKKQVYFYKRSSGLNKLDEQKNNNQKQAMMLGWLFGPAIIHYLQSLYDYCNALQSKPTFITSESKTFSYFYKILGFGQSQSLPKLNRSLMIQAYAKVLAEQNSKLSSILTVAKKILRRKTNSAALVTLGLSKPNSQKWNIIGHKQTNFELKNIDLKIAAKGWGDQLNKVIRDYKRIKKNSGSKVVMADIGWNDTIQILFTEILKEKNLNYDKLVGFYLGKTGTNIFNQQIGVRSKAVIFNSLKQKHGKYLYQPEVWESFLNSDNLSSETRQNILKGIKGCIEYYKKSQLTAEQLFELSHKKLYKTLKKPSKQTIETLGSLNFDYGTQDETVCPLVNLSVNRLKVYYWLFLKPSKFKDFYFHHGWKWGSANYYHYKLAYRLWRFKTKKPSF